MPLFIKIIYFLIAMLKKFRNFTVGKNKKSLREKIDFSAFSQKEKLINLLFNKVQFSVQRKGYTKIFTR